MIYTVHPATESDAHELAPLLRSLDRAEVLTLRVGLEEGLLAILRSSREA